MPKIEYTAKVGRVLAAERISPDELQIMLSRAAITSKGDCNRRYHHWLFLTVANESMVLDMKKVEPVGDGPVAQTCPRCKGQGGPCCNWWGAVRTRRN